MVHLEVEDLPEHPMPLFETWFEEVRAHGQPMPEAMTLATVARDGHPTARMVLLRKRDDSGLYFFTNYESDKADDLKHTPSAALVFWWESVRRQVRVRGTVTRASEQESDAYYALRPRPSQIGAWASPQSRELDHRRDLEKQVTEMEERFADGPVPRPPYWGGYRLEPNRFEFWQESSHRLHDRFLYVQKDGGWHKSRVAP